MSKEAKVSEELDAVIALMEAKVAGAVFNGIKAFEAEPRRVLALLLHLRTLSPAAQGRKPPGPLESPSAGLSPDEYRLRKMLAFSYSGSNLYGDDGELQDSASPFPIDYMRDSVEQIETAIHNRGMAALAKHQAALSTDTTQARDAWQPIETAPRDGRSVLLGYPGFVTEGYWDCGSKVHLICGLNSEPINPFTHWHKFPASPAPYAAIAKETTK